MHGVGADAWTPQPPQRLHLKPSLLYLVVQAEFADPTGRGLSGSRCECCGNSVQGRSEVSHRCIQFIAQANNLACEKPDAFRATFALGGNGLTPASITVLDAQRDQLTLGINLSARKAKVKREDRHRMLRIS